MRSVCRGMVWHLVWSSVLCLALACTQSACSFTQSAFDRTAGDAASAYAAAATTLDYAHHGKLTSEYASSTFVNYQSELTGLSDELPSLGGAPTSATTRHLVQLARRAERIVGHPCLDSFCAWRRQVATLRQTSRAFLHASGGS